MKYENTKRHGDMFFLKISDKDFNDGIKNIKAETLNVTDHVVVGLGETTGHQHVVNQMDNAQIVEYAVSEEGNDLSKNQPLFFRVSGGSAVVHHEEHPVVILEEGNWARTYQQVVDPFSSVRRAVED